MTIRPSLRNILKVVGDLSYYDVTTNVVDTMRPLCQLSMLQITT